MENEDVKNISELSSEDNPEYNSSPILISQDLLDKIHAFVALSNNHLMGISVIGDQILESAKVMNMANEIHLELEEVKNGRE